MPEQSNDYRIIVFGAGSVGKSSLVLRFVKDSQWFYIVRLKQIGTFSESYVPTIEDTYQQVISCNRNVCTLQITDCSGSHHFPAMQQLNINKGHAFMLVYSITSRQSLDVLIPIYQQIQQLKGGDGVQVPIMIVGNKCDEENRREVKKDLASKLVSDVMKDSGFMETSARLNVNVQQAFQELLSLDKTRVMSLTPDLKKSRSQIRKEKLKSKCEIM